MILWVECECIATSVVGERHKERLYLLWLSWLLLKRILKRRLSLFHGWWQEHKDKFDEGSPKMSQERISRRRNCSSTQQTYCSNSRSR
jgi:hypothetical protein